jgi:hypothetical protein
MDYYKDVFGMPTDSSWLRYLYVDTPYTAYINNRVTLTLVLDILVLYTYGRIRRLAYFDDPVTGPLVDIESTVSLPKYSTIRDLFTFASPGHPLCPASKPRRIFMIFWIFICVMATAAMVTWKLHQWVSDFWKMLNLVVSIVSKAHSGSWRQYAKMPKAGMPGVQLPEQIQYHGCVIAVVLVLSYLYLA